MNNIIDLEIVNIGRNGYNAIYCLEDCIATIAMKEGRDYKLIFSDLIDFEYDYTKALCENKVIMRIAEQSTYINSQYNNCERYYGLKFFDVKYENEKDLFDCLKCEISQNRPIIVKTDSYYCEWDVLYGKEHSKHMTICIGLDEEKVYLCDPFYGIKYREMTRENFKTANNGRIVTYIKTDDVPKINKEFLLLNVVNQERFDKRIKALNQFSKAFDSIFDYEKECDNFGDALIAFDTIYNYAMNTSKYFEVLKSIRNISSEVASMMTEVVGSWIVIKNMLFKGFFRKDNYVGKKVAARIKEIIEKELYIYNYIISDNIDLLNTCENECGNEFVYEDIEEKELFSIDIKSYLNNNSFGDYRIASCTSDLTGLKEFLQFEGNSNNLQYKNSIFHTYISPQNEYDNIQCEKQHIIVDINDYYSKICFLALSEFGETMDKVLIKYTDNSREYIHINISDFNIEPLYGEEIVWRGVTYARSNENIFERRLENAKIYFAEYRLTHKGVVESILLPDCNNLHIYGIYFK